MKRDLISFFQVILMTLVAAPLAAWAHTNPDFDDDATPILRMQPGLLEYVQSKFDVKDTGTAKYPGDDDRRPSPPYIFRARPAGSSGPYNLRLLIQPGRPGHILGVVDITKVHLAAPGAPPAAPSAPPSVANQPPPAQAPAPAPQPSQTPPVSSPQPTEPTADTPSGPITDSGSQAAPSSPQPSLEPPPDPPPATH